MAATEAASTGGARWVAWTMAGSGAVLVAATMLPWVRDEHGHGADGWNLYQRYGPIWDQAAEGFMDSSSVLPTGPVVALAGLALVIDAAWCLIAHRRAPRCVDAWLVAAVALIFGLPVILVDMDGGVALGAGLAALAPLVPLGALAVGAMLPYLRRAPGAGSGRGGNGQMPS